MHSPPSSRLYNFVLARFPPEASPPRLPDVLLAAGRLEVGTAPPASPPRLVAQPRRLAASLASLEARCAAKRLARSYMLDGLFLLRAACTWGAFSPFVLLVVTFFLGRGISQFLRTRGSRSRCAWSRGVDARAEKALGICAWRCEWTRDGRGGGVRGGVRGSRGAAPVRGGQGEARQAEIEKAPLLWPVGLLRRRPANEARRSSGPSRWQE